MYNIFEYAIIIILKIPTICLLIFTAKNINHKKNQKLQQHPLKILPKTYLPFKMRSNFLQNTFWMSPKQNSIGSNFKFCSPVRASLVIKTYRRKKRIAPFLRRSIFENSLRSHDRPRQLRVFPSVLYYFFATIREAIFLWRLIVFFLHM